MVRAAKRKWGLAFSAFLVLAVLIVSIAYLNPAPHIAESAEAQTPLSHGVVLDDQIGVNEHVTFEVRRSKPEYPARAH